jgi:toxin secretion/phage lysis holin
MKNNTQILFDLIAGAGLTILTFLFGNFDLPLQLLVFFVVVDYITGIVAAWVDGKLCSQVGAKGIAKKVGYFTLGAVIYQADKLFFTDSPLKTLTIWALAVNEFLSIIENLGKLGVPIPEVVADKIKKLKEAKSDP